MITQGWFVMAEIRRRKFATSAWILLREVQPICEARKRGQTLIANCDFAAMASSKLLERLLNSTCEESHGTK
jgi:hypothetical protein